MKPPLTNRELRQALRISEATFYRRLKAGELRRFALTRPVGAARWSGELVEKYLAGESLVAFGAGARVARRA